MNRVKSQSALRWDIIFSIAVLLYGASPTFGGELLRWKWQMGKQLRIVVRQQLQQEIIMAGKTMPVTGTQELEMSWVVEDVSEQGDAKLALEVQRLRVQMNLGDLGSLDYDSDQAAEAQGLTQAIGAPLGTLLGTKMVQVISSLGEVSEIVLPDATRQALEANPVARRLVDSVLSDLARQATLKLPEAEVDVGDQWQNMTNVTTELGSTQLITDYRYRGKAANEKGNFDGIDVTFTLRVADGPAGSTPLLKVAEQDNRGTIWFDNQAGQLNSAHFEQKQTLELGSPEQKVVQKVRKITDITVTLPQVPEDRDELTGTPQRLGDVVAEPRG